MRLRLQAVIVVSALLGPIACGQRDADTVSRKVEGTRAVTPADGRVEVGLPVPSYSTVSLNGDSVSLAARKGKVVLLNIWATWCHPCRTEIPELQALHARYRDRGLETIGVSVDSDGSDDAVRTFVKDYGMTFQVWRDPDERIANQFFAIGVPATFLIDRDGILRWRMTGPIAPGDTSLVSAIEHALGS